MRLSRTRGQLAPRGQFDRLEIKDSLNPAAIGRHIADLQAAVLLKLAEDKTAQLYLASFPTALPTCAKASDQSSSKPSATKAPLNPPHDYRPHVRRFPIRH